MNKTTNLRRAGLKTTQPRIKILEILETTEVRHMTAEDVFRCLLEDDTEIGLATVYRVLTQFESAGLVIRHNFEGGSSVFELNDESHHDHMVCLECGRVFEFFDNVIEERQKQIADKLGFTVEDHSLHLYGVCEGFKEDGVCSANKKKDERIFKAK
jgi:Fur family transcriptional regulator, ferric uptake regulator